MPTSKTPKTPTALIYCRLSKADDKSHSLESQEALCREEAARRGLEVRAVFSEIISGGVAAYTRPAFGDLLDSVNPGDVVLIRERSRLGRETLANLLSEKALREAGAQLVSLDGAGLEDTAETRMMKTILDAVSEYEKSLIGRRTRQALAARRAKGLADATPKMGSKRDAQGLAVEDRREQKTLKRARQLRLAGHTLQQVADQLQREGHRNRKGNPYAVCAVGTWLRGVVAEEQVAQEAKAAKTSRTGRTRSPNSGRKPAPLPPGLAATIAEMRSSGASYHKIAAELTRRGYRTSTGGDFHATQVRRLLLAGRAGSAAGGAVGGAAGGVTEASA